MNDQPLTTIPCGAVLTRIVHHLMRFEHEGYGQTYIVNADTGKVLLVGRTEELEGVFS